MMTFFPSPYDDELLYSVLGRYHIRSGNVSFDATMLDLFGKGNYNAIFDLPTNLGLIIRNMPIDNKYTVKKLINDNTLYPYYAAFLPANRAKEIIEIMSRGNGTGLYIKLGVGLLSEYRKHFKFCVKCLKEDFQKYGEYYWHRSHQAHGVHICTKHDIQLAQTILPIGYFHKREYKLPSDEICKSSEPIFRFNDNELAKLSKIAENSKYLFKNRLPFRELSWFVSQYKNSLMERNLCTVNGVVKMKDFVHEFKQYYGNNVLNALQLDIDDSDKINWLKDMVRDRGTARQTIKHLLLCSFLEIDIYKLFNEKIEHKPFGNEPWPCLNPVCENYMKPVISKVIVKNNSKCKSPVGTFKCSCGFTYLRMGPDKCEEDRSRIGRIMRFGEVWENKLKELIYLGHSFKEIERRMGSYHDTLKKYAITLGLSDYVKERCDVIPGINNKIEKSIDISKRNLFRKQWTELKIQYPSYGVSQLRLINNNLYDWLINRDKEWMTDNLPIKKERKIETVRINWPQRDKEILEKVKAISDELLKPIGHPQKVTLSLIGRKLGIKSYLFSNMNRLPRTKEYVHSIIEDSKTYQIRKAKWAIQELEREGEEIKFWKVYQKASLHEEFLHEYKEEILELILRT